MVNFQTTRISSRLKADELISRLAWQTHAVENVLFAEINTKIVDTHKRFIGKVDKQNRQFTLTYIRSPL